MADRLASLPDETRPRAVVSSPLRRCRETAEPLARRLGVPVIVDPAVGEIPTPANLASSDRPAWLRQAFLGDWAQVRGDLDYSEWRRAVADAVRGHGGSAVFSHFVAINALVSALEGSERVVHFRPDHTSVTTLELDGDRLSLVERGPEASTGVL